ncbi:hypothetical protein ACVWZZ_003447 [Bradyrhizobium sp. LM6.10]
MRSIFRQFVIERRSETKIARSLNSVGIPCLTGRPWTAWIIHNLLVNENYIGNIVYDRHPYRLRQRRSWTPADRWIRKIGAFEPVIAAELFAKAQSIIAVRKSQKGLSNEEMLKRLRILLQKKGRLTRAVIDAAPGVPRPSVYQLRFGTVRNAYRLIGYVPERDYGYIDSRGARLAVIDDHASRLGTALAKSREDVRFDRVHQMLEVGDLVISLRVARWCHDGKEGHSPFWTIECGRNIPPGLLLAIRLDASNESACDYFLMASSKFMRRLRFTEEVYERYGLRRVGTFESVVRAVKRRLR